MRAEVRVVGVSADVVVDVPTTTTVEGVTIVVTVVAGALVDVDLADEVVMVEEVVVELVVLEELVVVEDVVDTFDELDRSLAEDTEEDEEAEAELEASLPPTIGPSPLNCLFRRTLFISGARV